MIEKIDWQQELVDSAKFKKKQENLLKNGSKSLTDNWLLGALYTRWEKIKVYRELPNPNCQSAFLEWENRLLNGAFYVLTEDDVLYPDW
tara:strand:+ start:239 stop:505 length:267 start_codon:yes stop_codon:yes gene_type:complete